MTVRYTWDQRSSIIANRRAGEPVLSTLLLQQGVVQFFILFVWTLKITIAQQLLRQSISSVDIVLRNVVAIIILCRFHLELHERNEHFGNSSQVGSLWRSSQLGGFHSVMRRVEESIMEEFSDHIGLHT